MQRLDSKMPNSERKTSERCIRRSVCKRNAPKLTHVYAPISPLFESGAINFNQRTVFSPFIFADDYLYAALIPGMQTRSWRLE
jgi:hypothetical protein